MRNGTNIWFLNELMKAANENAAQIAGTYVPARPYGWTSLRWRFKAAWLVFTGKADAVIWPANQ